MASELDRIIARCRLPIRVWFAQHDKYDHPNVAADCAVIVSGFLMTGDPRGLGIFATHHETKLAYLRLVRELEGQ